ncbi:serine protease inhibitor Kazal-type 8 isoform X2 [Pipistrellus kuhlii]|uniref:serine protease inhibitor Kazal-type 8 isoform X2 n=1 Tax=Pipistrellus kuhlii TaxID=59472 RepID=UPI00174F3A71|nr:serine protease inhibitor Kazal-type 8 isoform X2 [Pipistrellus kuhlii]
MPVPGALLSAVLLLASSTPAGLAVDFLLPTGDRASLRGTQAICNNEIHQCWFVSVTKPSEPVCGSDRVTYNGECHLCYAVLYKKLNITKLHDGPCVSKVTFYF